MAGTLHFNARDVARLIVHAADATTRLATWSEKLEEGARLRGVHIDDLDTNEWGELVEAADESGFAPEPSLHFVHDQGLYVMSNGRPNLAKDDPERVVYAEGFNPNTDEFDDWWEGARAIVGGDDFVEPLPAEQHVEIARKVLDGSIKEPTWFYIKVTSERFSYGFDWS